MSLSIVNSHLNSSIISGNYGQAITLIRVLSEKLDRPDLLNRVNHLIINPYGIPLQEIINKYAIIRSQPRKKIIVKLKDHTRKKIDGTIILALFEELNENLWKILIELYDSAMDQGYSIQPPELFNPYGYNPDVVNFNEE